jgi:3-hydroxyacyl-[acyl-carrier-protein] dehydratase
MPPPAILDPASLDFDRALVRREEILSLLPQRYEFQLLDAVLMVDLEQHIVAGYHDVRTDAWWTRGHIPGRPLFPGVLMIEVAAQLCSYAHKAWVEREGFMGFAALDQVKFRGAVEPPCRFVVVARATELKRRRTTCQVQGFVESTMVFEGVIQGMPI